MPPMSNIDKGEVHGRPIRGMGQAEPSAGTQLADGDGVPAVPEGPPQEGTTRSGEEDQRDVRSEAGRGKAGLSLRSHHEKLNREGYVPPPPVEVPLRYAGKSSGRRCLTDEQVIQARLDVRTVGIKELAKRHGVSVDTMTKAVKGFSYKHLNAKHTPQL